jgi:hypothetical protein
MVLLILNIISGARMKERLECEVLLESMSVDGNKLMANAAVYLDHVSKSGEKDGEICLTTSFNVIDQIKGSFGVEPEFGPYERVDLTNTYNAIERLRLCCEEILRDIKAEIKLMDTDPHYFEIDDEEEE